jgi:tRNA(Ile)-lysidine synthase
MKKTDVGKVSWPSFPKRYRSYCRAFYNKIVFHDKNVIVGCSGGVDSVVLAHVIQQAAILQGFKKKVFLLYCNHNLRPEVDEEAEFVKSISCGNFLYSSFIIPRGNVQLNAREYRYNEMCRHAVENDACVYLAHHANDVAESKIFQFLTGRQANGIKETFCLDNIDFYRPLLSFTKEHIKEYAKVWSLDWKEDSSNQSSKYTRNFIRNELIPMIQEGINPGVVETLSNL